MEVVIQYKVPQKIDLEDKIIGPLTLVQFMYLMGGGMAVYVVMNLGSTVLFIFLGLPIALLALALAFLKIQDQPFAKFLLASIMFVVRPKERFWQKDIQKERFESEITSLQKEKKPEKKIEVKSVNKSELEKLAQALDVTTWEKIQKNNTGDQSISKGKNKDIVEDIFSK